jgi:hypothetical protein
MDLNHKIKTAVIFENGKILPRWFIWQNQRRDIRSINYVWEDKEGYDKLIHFAVSDNTNTYELTYNSSQTVWRLSKIDAE